MVTIQIKRTNDYDNRPELDQVRQTFSLLQNHVASHHDTPNTGTFVGSFLANNAAVTKLNHLNARKYENSQREDEGNLILETKLTSQANYLILNIDLRDIGIVQGRGSYDLTPTVSGFWLRAQELDCYKNSNTEEAHAIKRNIVRRYEVKGSYDWKNMVNTLMPDGILHVAVTTQHHPSQMTCALLPQTPIYTSAPEKSSDFPPSNSCQTFKSFLGFSNPHQDKCLICGGVKSVGVQTGSSIFSLPMQSDCFSSIENFNSNSFISPSTNTLSGGADSNYLSRNDVRFCSCNEFIH